MIGMISSKTNCRWNSHSNIAENSKGFIYKYVRMSCPMSKVMDQNVACMVDSSAKNIDDG